MVVSTESAIDLADVDLRDLLDREYENVVVYGDADPDSVLHEGNVRLLANGWVELPTDRLLSPEAVHHIDKKSE
ncbi:hypothetical protein AArcSl_2637 [Halalkaliarchaeum desulfuricum]|uniref:Uncharacterized protein n=1 Tax=Halalkaliarchaeum desulfuricum TaxID=2055893 RepID=A0A343TMD4_9EURY|nr:hypothetical protein [Halalkaliarchaeum desulfuricum]AUX10256.1 hypothetical protein AArcSl_2637 [Halalkaliarchaeum desulfuricum]